ncbi:hypothetical protein K437DRAFT_256521 [Tilletiaria anomala UBC 951]|uniref:Uncharacterized protein n=1 Tax=Tilletiaria anomala (strain ATCC 24038 / CBS 436.72 / UBC 951) TaxID=1037660 RepID=A0A066W3D0_TILAU|nr:uncharacterized protein K437DRAFT_256521 [Tilletiaria anomala UBC 951]KDN45599.1 hypothetical protein K437DRAFT_256521 [Tilletiaria anomala UBC 951]
MASSFKIKLRLPTRDEDEAGMSIAHHSSTPFYSDSDAQSEEERDELEDSGDDDQSLEASSVGQAQSSPLRPKHLSSPIKASAEPSPGKLKAGAKKSSKKGEGPSVTKRKSTGSLPNTKAAASAAASVDAPRTLDDLPASKRRKVSMKLGAAGPGRGWRKGLKHGMKPLYKMPDGSLVPMSIDEGRKLKAAELKAAQQKAAERGSSPLVPKQKGAAATGSPAPSAASAAPKKSKAPARIVYPPIPVPKNVVPVKNYAKIPMSFPAIVPLDRSGTSKLPRRWTQGKREILTLGGRVLELPTWWGGPNLGFEPVVKEDEVAQQAGTGSGKSKCAGAGTGTTTTPGTGGASTPVPTTKNPAT